jgi:hypothetical protein
MHPDANVFNDLVAKIQETNKFAFVRWGEYDGTLPAAGASVLIVRANFTYDEPHSSADEDERAVNFVTTLRYINSDANVRRGRVLQLEAVIYNIIHHKRLGSPPITIPGKTIVRRGVDGRPTRDQTAGLSIVRYECTFTHRIAPKDGMSED